MCEKQKQAVMFAGSHKWLFGRECVRNLLKIYEIILPLVDKKTILCNNEQDKKKKR